MTQSNLTYIVRVFLFYTDVELWKKPARVPNNFLKTGNRSLQKRRNRKSDRWLRLEPSSSLELFAYESDSWLYKR